MKLENSETLQNLVNAFAGESQARNKYTFYAKIAKKEGYEQISQIFLDTAENEREHAKLFYEEIPNAEHLQVTGEYPFFNSESTLENLISASKWEREEWEEVYRHGAEVAKAEGFDDIAELFEGILEIEKHHAHRFELLADELQADTLFSKEEQTQWICRKCGHIQISKCAPKECPVCEHPQGYFEVFTEKF
ncbi:MAG: rubrerythrin family protein [Candidatus Gastranaerophilales bacterium]|nr:rubrerythrin family protein [Candidatus Gastranaerophilales bacterium]MCM1073467.1 rubrerythrin family protein [Bacteroides sp.]